jgi:hypothetical protein
MTTVSMVTVDLVAGSFEACDAFRAPVEHDEPVCAGCGHLADDHAPESVAPVTRLRRRPRAAVPARKAS